MTHSEPDSATPPGEPASAERSPSQDLNGRPSLWSHPATGSSGWPLRAERKRERAQMPGWRRWGGWGQKGWKCGRDKQGDPLGTERSSWPQGPKSRRAGVRASVVAKKRGNARGAKGRRKVEVGGPGRRNPKRRDRREGLGNPSLNKPERFATAGGGSNIRYGPTAC
jgi:hypothetical protein